MKTFEFIDQVEQMGYTVQSIFGVEVRKGNETVLTVWKDRPNAISCIHEVDSDLFDLAIMYARTPVNERAYKGLEYIEYMGNGFFIGRRYNMVWKEEQITPLLCFGENVLEGQVESYSSNPGLRGPAGMFSMVQTPKNYGLYWQLDDYFLPFKDVVLETHFADYPFEGGSKYIQLLHEVKTDG